MTDIFQQPIDQRSTLGKIAGGLQGFGAGFRGGGSQFLAQRQQQQQTLSKERLQAAAEDLRRARRLLDDGDLQGVRDLAQERVGMIQELGGDPGDTQGLLSLADAAIAGDQNAFNALNAQVDAGLQSAADRGIIKLPKPAGPLSPQGKLQADIRAGLVTPEQAAQKAEQFRVATQNELEELGLPLDTPGVQINTRTNRASIPGRGVSVRVGDIDKSAAAKAATGFLTGVIEKGNASTEILNNADLLDLSLNKVGGTAFDTGIFGELRADLGRLAILTGRGEAFQESIAGAENIDSISNKLKILETQALKGAISNREFAAAGKINTDLGNTNLGNRFAVKRMRAVARMSQWQNQRFEEIDNANPDITDKGLSRLLKKEFRGIPYVSQKLKDGQGLPLFFTEFRDEVLKDDPNISTKVLIEQWKAIHR